MISYLKLWIVSKLSFSIEFKEMLYAFLKCLLPNTCIYKNACLQTANP